MEADVADLLGEPGSFFGEPEVKEVEFGGNTYREVSYVTIGLAEEPGMLPNPDAARGRGLITEYLIDRSSGRRVLNAYLYIDELPPEDIDRVLTETGSPAQIAPGVPSEYLVRSLGSPDGEGRCPSPLLQCADREEHVWAWVWSTGRKTLTVAAAIDRGRVSRCWHHDTGNTASTDLDHHCVVARAEPDVTRDEATDLGALLKSTASLEREVIASYKRAMQDDTQPLWLFARMQIERVVASYEQIKSTEGTSPQATKARAKIAKKAGMMLALRARVVAKLGDYHTARQQYLELVERALAGDWGRSQTANKSMQSACSLVSTSSFRNSDESIRGVWILNPSRAATRAGGGPGTEARP